MSRIRIIGLILSILIGISVFFLSNMKRIRPKNDSQENFQRLVWHIIIFLTNMELVLTIWNILIGNGKSNFQLFVT